MRITVHLHTVYQKPSGNGLVSHMTMDVEEGSTLAHLLDILELEINQDDTLLVLNGKIAEATAYLNNGDVVHIIPAIAGGKV